MKEWIITINREEAICLGSIRSLPNLKAAMDSNHIWLRGLSAEDALPVYMRQLPIQAIYQVDEENRLFPAGNTTPTAKLPELRWQILPNFLSVEPPTSALPARVTQTYQVALRASEAMKEGVVLRTSLATWKAYGMNAAMARLAVCQFAVSEHQEVFIQGKPLPSLPGKEYWFQGDLLLPCGYELSLPIATTLIEKRLNPTGDAFVLFEVDGTWTRILKSNFVKASRSAIRLTRG